MDDNVYKTPLSDLSNSKEANPYPGSKKYATTALLATPAIAAITFVVVTGLFFGSSTGSVGVLVFIFLFSFVCTLIFGLPLY